MRDSVSVILTTSYAFKNNINKYSKKHLTKDKKSVYFIYT